MQLAQWQKNKILELRRQYLVALGHVLQERQEVETGLQVGWAFVTSENHGRDWSKGCALGIHCSKLGVAQTAF